MNSIFNIQKAIIDDYKSYVIAVSFKYKMIQLRTLLNQILNWENSGLKH